MTTFAGQIPQLWPDTSYRQFLRVETDGQSALTHQALLVGPDGIRRRGFVKHYTAAAPQGLFNEWFGYAVLSTLGVPQPEAAITMAPFGGSGPMAYAFVSMFPGPTTQGTPKQLYDLRSALQLEVLKQRLFACPALPCLIAADQLLGNCDRNIGNLVFTGTDQFVAIDQGSCFGSAKWKREDLWFAPEWARSKLIEDLVPLSSLTVEFRDKLLAAAEVVEETYFAFQNDLRKLLDADNRPDVKLAMHATWWRCLRLSEQFRQALGALT